MDTVSGLATVEPGRHGDPVHRSVYAMSKLLAIRELGAASCTTQEDRLRIEMQAQTVIEHQDQ